MLKDCGFEIVAEEKRFASGVEVNFVARDAAGAAGSSTSRARSRATGPGCVVPTRCGRRWARLRSVLKSSDERASHWSS